MDAKDLRTESSLGERGNDGSSKYAHGVAVLPCNTNKTYEAMSSNPLSKVETPTTRPCAVIGPDRIVPQPSASDAYLKKGHYEPWQPMDTTYRPQPEYPHKMPSYLSPLGNISPRQTFQENMPRIMVQPTYNSKVNDDPSYTLDRNLSKSNKIIGAPEPKYCDVPYTVNQTSTDPKSVEMCVPNVNNARSYPQMWHPTSVNTRPARPYGAPDPYQYPEYASCASTRPVQMSRPHRTMNEDPGHVYNDTYYQESNIRFKPYPNIKERYPQSRYEYATNYGNPFHPPHPYPPYKYDMQKAYPPHMQHSQVPIKYVENRMSDSSLDGYQRPQQGQYASPYRNPVIHPAYGPMLSSNLPNKIYSYPPEGPVKSIATNKLPYDNKLYLDYDAARNKGYPMSDSFYDMRPHMKNQMIIPNYPPANMQPIHPHSYYRKENLTTKNYEYISHLRHLDPMLNPNALSKLSSQFSPSSIAISPSDSNTSNDTVHTQGALLEDCGYVSQSSTASIRSVDSSMNRIMPNDFYRRYNYAYPTTVRTSPLTSKPEVNNQSSNKDKKGIDVRQFLQMWNEGEEENGGNAKEAPPQPDYSSPNKPSSQYEIVKNHEQLYVLGLTNVPSEELGKYEHIQKVSKLPENIKGYNNIELLKHFEEAIESSNLSNLNHKQNISRHYQMTTKQSLMHALPPRPLSPLDVEAKISQSVIHKEVGCNFEIKPCSPEMLNVEAATLAQKILNERTIEKVTNPSVNKSPMLSKASENENICNLIKQNDHNQIINESNKISSCNMQNTQCSNDVTSAVKANYTLQDLESNASVCLASLPRLDNDIELNFPEVNQQFINANKESVITTTDSNLKPNNMDFNMDDSREMFESKSKVLITSESEKEFSKLSKYRKVKKIEGISKETDFHMNSQSLRTDSVIIKNPENTKIMEYDAENQSNDIKRIEELQDSTEVPTSGSCKTYDNTKNVKEDLTNEIAIDFSLSKINVGKLPQNNTSKPNEKPLTNKKIKRLPGKKRLKDDTCNNNEENLFSNTLKNNNSISVNSTLTFSESRVINSGENKIKEKNLKRKSVPHNLSSSVSPVINPNEIQTVEKKEKLTSTNVKYPQIHLLGKEDYEKNINSDTSKCKDKTLDTPDYEDSSDTLSASSDENNEHTSKNEIHEDAKTFRTTKTKVNETSTPVLSDSAQNIYTEFDIKKDENIESENLAIRNSSIKTKGNEEFKKITSSNEHVSQNSVTKIKCSSLDVERDFEKNNNIETNSQNRVHNKLNENDLKITCPLIDGKKDANKHDLTTESQSKSKDFSNCFKSSNVAHTENSFNSIINVSSQAAQVKCEENNNLGSESQGTDNTFLKHDKENIAKLSSELFSSQSFKFTGNCIENSEASTDSKSEECKNATSFDNNCEHRANQEKNDLNLLKEAVSSTIDKSSVVNSIIEPQSKESEKSQSHDVSHDIMVPTEIESITNNNNSPSMNCTKDSKENYKFCESESSKKVILESSTDNNQIAIVKTDSMLMDNAISNENNKNTKVQSEENEGFKSFDECKETQCENVKNTSTQISNNSINFIKDSEEKSDLLRKSHNETSTISKSTDNCDVTAQKENDNYKTETQSRKNSMDKEDNENNTAHSSNNLDMTLKQLSATEDVKSTNISLDTIEVPEKENYMKSEFQNRNKTNVSGMSMEIAHTDSNISNNVSTSTSRNVDKNLILLVNSEYNYSKSVDMYNAISKTESDIQNNKKLALDNSINPTEFNGNGYNTFKNNISEKSASLLILKSSNNTCDINKRTMGKELFSPWIQKLFFKNEGKCVNKWCSELQKERTRHYFNLSDINVDTFPHIDISHDRVSNYVSENENIIDDLIIDQTNVLSQKVELSQITEETCCVNTNLINNNILCDIDITIDNRDDELKELFADISNNDESITEESGIFEIRREIGTAEKSFNEDNCNLMYHIPCNIDCDEDSIEKSLNLIHAESPPDIVQPITQPTFSRSLKRSLSDSALNVYNSDTQELFSQKAKKLRNNKTFLNVFNIQNNRRNSISSIYDENMSFCIVIDNNCIIAEEIEEEEKLCYNISEECLQTIDGDSLNEGDIVTTEDILLCPQDDTASYVEPLILEMSDEKTFEESWVEDVACVETVVSDDIAEDVIISAPSSPKDMNESDNEESDVFNDSEHTEKVKYIYGDKMCNDDAELVETLYRTPQMDVNKTLANREPHVNENLGQEEDQDNISESLDLANYSNPALDSVIEQTSNNSVTMDITETLDHKKSDTICSEDFKTEPSGIKTIDTSTNSSHEKTQYDNVNYPCKLSNDHLFSPRNDEYSMNCSFSSPEVSSTTTEEKNSTILLKITNYKGTRTSQINDVNLNKSNSCRFTENVNYTSYHSNSTEPRPLLTKAAQKYIPPPKDIVVDDLKVKLPLPPHSLMKFKQLKISRDEQIYTSVTKNNIQKKPKPKFEDVLKSIDEMQFKRHKEKGKKIKKSIPKVVIKKTENGSHYASTPVKESYNPDLTGRKWQPWVFIEKNIFIDKMAIRKKTKAIYNHRKNTYVFADKFKKYKSIQSAKFVISQPNTKSSAGQFKYTIRLKHSY